MWTYALDMGGTDIYNEDLTGAVALVVGAEGKGVSRLTKELCDGVLSLPMRGKINSLNASVAAALGIYAKPTRATFTYSAAPSATLTTVSARPLCEDKSRSKIINSLQEK